MIKQIIVMRTDLRNVQGQKVRTGKLISQACHASIMFLSNHLRKNDSLTSEEKEWIDGIFTKIVVGIDSEQQLRDLMDKARLAGLVVHEVIDSGNTEFNKIPTLTCAAFGPHEESRFVGITSDLKLL